MLRMLKDDGTIDLAIMASKHPDFKTFGKIVLRHMKTTSKLCRTGPPPCRPARGKTYTRTHIVV